MDEGRQPKESPEKEPLEMEPDSELVRKAVQGDEGAFETLVRRKRERTFWIAYRIVGNEDDARDIAQSAFVRLWRVLPKYRPDQAFDTWLYRIVVNLAIDHYRTRGPARATVPLMEDDEPRVEASQRAQPLGDPLEALTGAELGRIFEMLASRLGEKQRAVFVMSQIEGIETEQIAAIMEISQSTVRNHLFQARGRDHARQSRKDSRAGSEQWSGYGLGSWCSSNPRPRGTCQGMD